LHKKTTFYRLNPKFGGKVMKKCIVGMLFLIFLVTGLSAGESGGSAPCLASCLIGPRVGLEMNEGKPINTSEWIGVIGSYAGSSGGFCLGISSLGGLISFGCRAYMAYDMGYKANEFPGFAASYCIGPRVGNELNTRKVRMLEWLRFVPCVCIYPMIAIPLEAYQGKTMTEIEAKEGLRK
jgi:hypothetical protein